MTMMSRILSRRLVRERVLPLEQQIDESGEVPAGLIEAAAEMGLYGFAIPDRSLTRSAGCGPSSWAPSRAARVR